ncbi:hypothetical protein Nans01_26170 [Nocardiopsis ansamitocini]|uniref:FAD-binding FR-type domain-containing protein n=1 Tax=Nocardiopsis ansamitocini TaxID=1670832 RepID=A0A9W6P6Y4_9ACTN|nr:hypothetical protein Nans01_26170 [Nocardiopsis ansamitocini]
MQAATPTTEPHQPPGRDDRHHLPAIDRGRYPTPRSRNRTHTHRSLPAVVSVIPVGGWLPERFDAHNAWTFAGAAFLVLASKPAAGAQPLLKKEPIVPQAPALIGDLAASALGRRARVLHLHEPAPGFLELELHATAPSGGWHPGHEVQFRVAPTLGRRYTVRTVGGPESEHIGIIAATGAEGPGTAWLRGLKAGAETTVLAGRHRPLREHGPRCLYLGDGCALGTLDVHARSGNGAVVAVEVPADAVTALAARWPRYHFLPAVEAPGDTLQSWLERAIADDEFTDLDGAVLLGHAQSIQRQRHALVDAQNLPRRAITTKPYWATGRQGL